MELTRNNPVHLQTIPLLHPVSNSTKTLGRHISASIRGEMWRWYAWRSPDKIVVTAHMHRERYKHHFHRLSYGKCSVLYPKKKCSYVMQVASTWKYKQRPHSQPAELFLAPSFSFSHVFIRNSALSAPVSIAVAAGYKTCMENLLVEISQHLTAWLAGVLAFLVCVSWPLVSPAPVINRNAETKINK